MRFLLGKGRLAQAQRELDRLGLSPAESPQLDQPGAALPASIPPTRRQGVWSPTYARITGTLWFMWFSMNFLYQGAFIWLPTLLTASQGSSSRSFLFNLVISLGQLPGTLIAAWLADRMSRRKLIALSLALLSGGSFLFGLLQNDAWVLSMGFLLMVFNGMAWGIGYPFSSELYPTRMRGSATGWATGFGRLGGVIAPLFVGRIIQGGGSINNVFTLLAVLPFLSALVLSTIKLETTGKALEEISAE
jgi:putative MFS transporter